MPTPRQIIDACEKEVAKLRGKIAAMEAGTFEFREDRIVDVDAFIEDERQRLHRLEHHLSALRQARN